MCMTHGRAGALVTGVGREADEGLQPAGTSMSSCMSDPSRFYPERVARDPRGMRPGAGPASVSPRRWAQLGRFVERAFIHRGDWRPGLREAVHHVVVEMWLHGASDHEVREALRSAVVDHPACGRYDHTMLTTSVRYSDQLVAFVQGCVVRPENSDSA